MVVHLDAGRTGATVVSIPRDTLVTRPSCPRPSGGSTAVAHHSMFNNAYAVGGPVCAVKTVEAVTGVRMDHYIEIDFSGFAKRGITAQAQAASSGTPAGTSSRPPSPPATRTRTPTRRPTGPASPLCTASWPPAPRRR
ncbi:hypothetical protein SVIOM74S_07460 [Streptomyces violarus]